MNAKRLIYDIPFFGNDCSSLCNLGYHKQGLESVHQCGCFL